MRPVLTSNVRVFLFSLAAATVLTTSAYADCTYELFNIASVKGTSVGDFIDQISDECAMSVIIADSEAETVLKKQMNKTYLKNLTINEVLDLIVKENGLQYTLQNNVLRVSYLNTKTYNIDYIISKRKGTGNANITLSSQSNTGSAIGSSGTAGAAGAAGASAGANSESGIRITSTDEVLFWDMLDKEIENVLNRPEDGYKAALPMINKNAGMITVTATGNQMKRLDTYLDDLQKKMQAQVLIDVKIYSVVFSDAKTTGVDWSQIYALQNIDLAFDFQNTDKVNKYTSTPLNTGTQLTEFALSGAGNSVANVFRLGAKGSINEVVKFLKTQGDVYSISNPKILTLNNQTALITAGTELFYSIDSSVTTAGAGSTPVVGQTRTVSSVFSGVLLDITPEISNDGTITLRVNPSISETASVINASNEKRTMPPDLSRRQMSSVISVKDGNRVILGGLINTKNVNDSNKVPLLGDIPFLGNLFKREGISKKTEEIIIIIEPHIIKKDGNTLKMADLGFTRLSEDQINKKEDTK